MATVVFTLPGIDGYAESSDDLYLPFSYKKAAACLPPIANQVLQLSHAAPFAGRICFTARLKPSISRSSINRTRCLAEIEGLLHMRRIADPSKATEEEYARSRRCSRRWRSTDRILRPFWNIAAPRRTSFDAHPSDKYSARCGRRLPASRRTRQSQRNFNATGNRRCVQRRFDK